MLIAITTVRIWDLFFTDAISPSTRQHRNNSSACSVSGGQDLVLNSLTLHISCHFPTPCRPITSVFVGQMYPKVLVYFCANQRMLSTRRAPEQTVGSWIRWTSGPCLSGVGWWAKLRAPRTSRLERPRWCAAFMAPGKQRGKMRLIWNVGGKYWLKLCI